MSESTRRGTAGGWRSSLRRIGGWTRRSLIGTGKRALGGTALWSIAIYEGATPFRLAPAGGRSGPVLRARDVTDATALGVADPFLVRVGSHWIMFLEVLNLETRKGEIAVATSVDGMSWVYDRIVLAEPFHLSYPYVFQWQGEWYMIPESHEAGAVRLYRAVDFPYRWAFERQLLDRPYVDSSVVRHEGRWWMFAADDPFGRGMLRLYHADALEQPWSEHPASPIVVGDRSHSRPGGRMLRYDERLFRIAQDSVPRYGSRLHAFEITKLTTEAYEERAIAENPILTGSGSGWNSTGMHHVDPHLLDGGRWIAVVDGYRLVRRVLTVGVRMRARARRRARSA